jgi:hypothetical protein
MIANVIMANPKTVVDLSEGTVLVTSKEDFNTIVSAYTDEPITTANGVVKFSELLKMVYDSLETGVFDLHEDLILDLRHDIESLKEINEGLTDTLLEGRRRYEL